MISAFGANSFTSIWYWVLTVLVWIWVVHRTLGVPYDMILRARRLDDVSRQVDNLAHLTSDRIVAVYERAGIAVSLIVGFVLASLFVNGFLNNAEIAQATFLLLFPLTGVGYSSLRTAIVIKQQDFRGEVLIRVLSRRRFWHQVIAVVSLLVTFAVAWSQNPFHPVP